MSGSRKIIQTNRKTVKQNREIDKRTKGISQDSYFVGPKKGYSPLQTMINPKLNIFESIIFTLIL